MSGVERRESVQSVDVVSDLNAWDQFWFQPLCTDAIAPIRGLLAVLAIVFFVSAWADVSFWYADGGPLSGERVASFLETGDLQAAGKWIVSPLFFIDAPWIYHAYLLIGILASVLVILGRGGRYLAFGLWLLVVGWANRSMLLSGLAESLLSMGLFAVAIAPAQAAHPLLVKFGGRLADRKEWSARFAQRLLATQITVVGVATFVTMLGGRVWFNGIGAYALAAPVQDRTFDWTGENSPLVSMFVHESLTHLMVIALPLGFAMAWIGKTNRLGQCLLLAWCLVVALLASHWLYASVFATMVMAIQPMSSRSHS
ncbi:MAG: hypothetical protein ACR2NZ_08815 [Rubripirellula sp.]